MTRDIDPLSAALSCVRRLSDEGLVQLEAEIANERERRHEEAIVRAAWLVVGSHLVCDHDRDLLRREPKARQFRMTTACGRVTVRAERITPEGGVACVDCKPYLAGA
jgi:hypothetical protein